MTEDKALLDELWHSAHPGVVPPVDPDEEYERLVQGEENAPGSVVRASVAMKRDAPDVRTIAPNAAGVDAIFDAPNGPLIPVSAAEQQALIEKTAAERWGTTSQDIKSVSTIDELVQIIETAQSLGKSIRFVGSARSLSRASQPAANGQLGVACKFGDELALDVSSYRSGVDAATLYSAEAGRVMANVLIDLNKSGRALADMGSGDFQGLVGALSTSTHGSGVKYPALPGIVRSMDVVTVLAPEQGQELGRVVKQRIEPKSGITDPAAFAKVHASDGLKLIQDDDVFRCWTVSLGCLGVIFSVVLDVQPEYWLHETRTVVWWSAVKNQMMNDLNQVNYYEILVDPLSTKNGAIDDHKCLVTSRNIVAAPAHGHHIGGRPLTMKVAQTELGRLVAAITLASTIRAPVERAPHMINLGVTSTQVEGYTDIWYKVLLLRLDVNANSTELGIPLENQQAELVDPQEAILATEVILAQASANYNEMSKRLTGHNQPFVSAFDTLVQAWEECPVHTSPISLRFASATDAYLAMQVGKPSCMIEMPMPGSDRYDERLRQHAGNLDKNGHKHLKLYDAYVKGRLHLFKDIETRLASLSVRPHWGQTNFMTWEKTQEVYPEAKLWREHYEVANRDGVFNSPLTDQLGISVERLPESGEQSALLLDNTMPGAGPATTAQRKEA